MSRKILLEFCNFSLKNRRKLIKFPKNLVLYTQNPSWIMKIIELFKGQRTNLKKIEDSLLKSQTDGQPTLGLAFFLIERKCESNLLYIWQYGCLDEHLFANLFTLLLACFIHLYDSYLTVSWNLNSNLIEIIAFPPALGNFEAFNQGENTLRFSVVSFKNHT